MKTKWKTKDGRNIKIKDMKTSHLQKSIHMMRKNGFCGVKEIKSYLFCNCGLLGDGTQMAFDMELDQLLEKRPSKILDALEEELKKRFDTSVKQQENKNAL